MKTSVETLDPVQVKLTVEVEPARVKKAFDRAARELAKQVQVPGFRPGKAPRRLIEQRLGAGAIAQAAMESSLTDYYLEAARKEQLAVVGQPEVELDTFDEASGCSFTATVQVRPDVDPPEHTGISVSFPEWDVDDDDVEEQLTALRERFAEVDEVDRPARTGDFITLDLSVEVDGQELDSARVEDALYEVGSGGVTPELDEQAVGTAAGDSFTYEDRLPDGYPEHGGEQATFHVSVKDVRARSLPDLDDDFATSVSGFDTLDELRADIRRSLSTHRLREAQHELRSRVVEAYLARVEVPLPPVMVDAEAERRVHDLEHQAQRVGLEVDDLIEAQGTTRDELEGDARAKAEATVKAQLVLDRLADVLEISVEPAEIEQEIVRHAQVNGVAPQEIARIIQEQGSLPMLLGDIRRRKVIDTLVDAAGVDGGPTDDVLIELGLKEDPAAAAAEPAPGLVVPGQEPDAGDGASELIVPGRD